MNLLQLPSYKEINKEHFQNRRIKLSVFCLTYNHAEFIKDALEGFISQKTDFDYEVIIFDDASTDGTQEIIKRYCALYPTLFHAFLGRINIFNHKDRNSFFRCFYEKMFTGEYVAWCEGDDCWTDSGKLQTQVDYLDRHPECVLTMHSAERYDYETNTNTVLKGDEPEHDIGLRELLLQQTGIWPTASMAGKREIFLMDEDFFWDRSIGDWTRQLYAATKGTIHFFPRPMSLYRYKHSDSWSKVIAENHCEFLMHQGEMVDFLFEYDKYTHMEYHDVIVMRAARYYWSEILEIENVEEYTNACRKADERTFGKFSWYYRMTGCILKRLHEVDFVDDGLASFVNELKDVYIMGTGKLSKLLYDKLVNYRACIRAYVVSDNQILNGEGNVVKLRDVDWGKEGVGIIIGISGFQLYETIKANIRRAGVQHAMFPFLIEEKH